MIPIKIALITDTHWGCRQDSPSFHRHFDRFYNGKFFPFLDKHGIKDVIHLGDFVDRDRGISYVTLQAMNYIWHENVIAQNLNVLCIVGNHDVPHKNTLNADALTEIGYGETHDIIGGPMNKTIGGMKILFVPWICDNNREVCFEQIKNTDARVCMGHFEFAGFSMYRGFESKKGISPADFKKFDAVYSGHYHEPSKKGNIQYLGAPYEMTWADAGCERGFWVMDTDDPVNLIRVKNNNRIFLKIPYDEEKAGLVDNSKLAEYLTDKYIRIVIEKKTNQLAFDQFVENISKCTDKIQISETDPDVNVIEDIIQNNEEILENTLTIIERYVTAIPDENVPREDVKDLLREIYIESLKEEI